MRTPWFVLMCAESQTGSLWHKIKTFILSLCSTNIVTEHSLLYSEHIFKSTKIIHNHPIYIHIYIYIYINYWHPTSFTWCFLLDTKLAGILRSHPSQYSIHLTFSHHCCLTHLVSLWCRAESSVHCVQNRDSTCMGKKIKRWLIS